MKVKVLMEVEVPDGTHSCYECDDQEQALGAEIAENIASEVKCWLCNEVVGLYNADKVTVNYRKFYPDIFVQDDENN